MLNCKRRLQFVVNSRKILTLTDFVESTFGGENAKNSGFCAKMRFNSRRVYRAKFNHAPALRKSALALRNTHRVLTKMAPGARTLARGAMRHELPLV